MRRVVLKRPEASEVGKWLKLAKGLTEPYTKGSVESDGLFHVVCLGVPVLVRTPIPVVWIYLRPDRSGRLSDCSMLFVPLCPYVDGTTHQDRHRNSYDQDWTMLEKQPREPGTTDTKSKSSGPAT